jgi:tripartite-type tricarboxylate transporter receptor subunit TctC
MIASKLARRVHSRLFMVMFALLTPLGAAAADIAFPNGPVRIVVPFPAGGPTDTLVRVLQQNLQGEWKGTPVIVENKAGGDTIIGTNFVAKAAPDGQTLGVVVTAHTINPTLRSKMPYDTLKDLAGVTQLVNTPLALVAYADAPFNTVAELIAYARKNPGKLTYATPGTGTSTHLAGELFKTAAGVNIMHVPYKGSGPAQLDLVSGRVDLMFDVFSSALPMVESGKLKVIGLSLDHRLANYEKYPAIAETVPHFNVSSIIGIVAPAATPRPILEKIQADIAKAMKTKDMRDRLATYAMEPVASTPAQFDALIRSELTRWARIVKDNNIHAE